MRVYEEYNTPAEKRRAQRAAKPLKRGNITGRSRGYVLVFNEDGNSSCAGKYTYGGIANVYNTEPGDGPHSLASADPSLDYLQTNCRIVGFDYLPPEWQKAFANHIERLIDNDYYRDNPGEAARYRRLIRKVRKAA